MRRLARLATAVAAAGAALLASGCAVVTVAGLAVGAVATVGGLAVDATVATVKVTGKAVAKTVDLVTPSSTPPAPPSPPAPAR